MAQKEGAARAAEAERANRYKSEFLANMSHELRTPLNSALILAKLLADNKSGNLTEEQVQFAGTIQSAGRDLLVLISDVLDLSKIEAGRLDVHVQRFALERLVGSLSRTFDPIARDRGLSLSIGVDEGVPASMESDPQRLEQVLSNLLSNALKFTQAGGVSLRISARGSTVVFTVRDTGIGIAKEDQAWIFDAFRQVDAGSSRKYTGTGLGLSIASDLAHLLGGRITVDSEPGRGSAFTLELPLEAPTAPSNRKVSARANRGSGRDPLRASSGVAPAPPPAVADDRNSLDRSRLVLLVVEDDAPFAQILCDAAHELGFQCLVAHDGETGFALAADRAPSAIVLDIRLPDHSGLSVLDRLKRNPATRHIPVHVISIEDHAQAALEMGAVGFLRKPAEREPLIEALRALEARFTRRVRRLLIVDDDATEREGLGRLLGGDRVEIVGVSSVDEALEELRRGTFDCVVTDLGLQGPTGFELLERMAADEQYAFPPVIVYTGSSLSVEEEQRLRRYSSSIIVKGARSPERLLDEVTLFLHQVESEQPAERRRMLERARDREAAFEGRTILVVEDVVRKVVALTSALESKGARVVIGRNGREAIAALEKDEGIDLVLMDLMMPEMDGLEATREIRKRPEWAKLPIVALTAKAMEDDQQRCREAGANDYIAKPFDLDVLLSLVRVWMPR